MEKHHSVKEKKSSTMNWIVVQHGSSTESNVSKSPLTATEPMVNPRVIPTSGEYEISHEELFNLEVHDDEDLDYCIVNKETIAKGDGTDGMKKNIGDNYNGAEGLNCGSVKTVSDRQNINKSPFHYPKSGQPYLNSAGNVLVSPNVSMTESSAGIANEKQPDDDYTNFDYLAVKDDMVELQFEIDLRLAKNLEMKHMNPDGNCLFRAVASQVYGNSELYDLARQTCIAFLVRNHEQFSRFISEDFMSYCMRKRNDKVFGETLELFALANAYDRPIHIYSCVSNRVQVVHPPYAVNSSPIRLSCHYGNHYNSLVELPNEFPILGERPTEGPAKLFEGGHFADDQPLRKSTPRSSNPDIMAAFMAWQSGDEPKLGGTIVMGPGVKFNSIDLALSLGFSFPKVAVAYNKFGNDGSSMLYHLFESDTYDYEVEYPAAA